jgi:hypothetical protein
MYSDGVLWLSVYSDNVLWLSVYSDGVLWLSVYSDGVLWLSMYSDSVLWLSVYSDGVLWLSVYKNWDSRTVGHGAGEVTIRPSGAKLYYVNLIYRTTAVQNSYCYCVDVEDGELFNCTAWVVIVFCDKK